MAKILAPNKDYSGISAGIMFSKGIGFTSNALLIDWFRSKGYEVVEENEPESQVEEPVITEPDLESMTVKELKAYAAEKEIDLGRSTSKNGILEKILKAKKTG